MHKSDVCVSLHHDMMWCIQLLRLVRLLLHRHGMHVQLRCVSRVVLVLLLLMTDITLLLGTGRGHLLSL